MTAGFGCGREKGSGLTLQARRPSVTLLSGSPGGSLRELCPGTGAEDKPPTPTPCPGPASLPEVEVGESCEIPQGWVQTSQAIVVEAQALQGHQLARRLRHLGEPVPGQV